MWAFRIFLVLIIIALVIGFSIYNSGERTTANLFGREYVGVPMIYVAFWAFVVGMLVSFLLGVLYYFRIQADLKEQKKENKKLLEEITTLRNLPLEDVEEK